MRHLFATLAVLFVSVPVLMANVNTEDPEHQAITPTDLVNIFEDTELPLFVSLGAKCGPALILKHCNHRRAAFPFDFIISGNGEKLIDCLNEDFSNFCNEAYIGIFENNKTDEYYPISNCYHFHFPHDYGWTSENHAEKTIEFKEKYGRRIRRFRTISDYPNKVYFLRTAYMDDIITEEYSLRLFDALKDFFPKIDFSLIMINPSLRREVQIEKRVSDHILMIRAPIHPDRYDLSREGVLILYEDFFSHLIRRGL